jgi:hypothetical protein
MMKILTDTDEQLESDIKEEIARLVSCLPSVVRFDPSLMNYTDILIAAGGFEDRALVSSIVVQPSAIARAVLLRYKPDDQRNRLEELRNRLRGNGFCVGDDDVLDFDRYDPEGFSETFRDRLLAAGAERVVLDISAMSKLAILLCLDVCRELNLETSIIYSEAETKGPSREQYQLARVEKNLHRPSIQLYTGIHGVIHVARLSSVAMQGQPSAAIAFMSFNELLTQALLNAVFPSRLFLINSRSPTWQWRESATAWIHEQLRAEWPAEDNPIELMSITNSELPKRTASALDYKEALKLLLGLYWELAVDHRILLAPTGSKMQTVACFLTRALHPDIHIEYPTPEGFFENYSSGVGASWLISFGPLGDLLKTFRLEERRLLLGIQFPGNSMA